MTENKTKKYLLPLFIVLAAVSIGLVLFKFDFQILFFIRDYIRNPFLNVVVPFYTTLGDDGIIWIALGLIMLIPQKTRKCGIMVLAALLVMVVFNNLLLKNIIARARPFTTYPELIEDLIGVIHVPSSYFWLPSSITSLYLFFNEAKRSIE